VESIYEEVSLEGKIAEKAITLFCKEQSGRDRNWAHSTLGGE